MPAEASSPPPNPLSVQFWLWGQDALRGDLEAQGFAKSPNPGGRGSSLYRRGAAGLHSSAAWLETPRGVAVYSRPREGFFLLDSAADLPALPARPSDLDYAAGLALFRPLVAEYEAWVLLEYGPEHRPRQLRQLPFAARRHRPAWEAWALGPAPRPGPAFAPGSALTEAAQPVVAPAR